MATFAKPENALKRAEELMNVGQKQAALQALHDVITNKRHRSWQKTLESIMFKYIELCVDMRKGRFAKDGLIQYRIICQQVNVSSLEEVIKYFMKLSTEKAEEAQLSVDSQVTDLDVKDLEEENNPEDLMLSYVSGEKGKERMEKETVTPWFKFLWETYRSVLEILRNNCKLEALYAMTAHKAFQFCIQYKRTTEFRRLCDIIRNHLSNLIKYKDQRDRPELTQPETLQLYIDTRFEQLRSATELEMWQEAFRSVEDIYGLMCHVKKTPKPQLMAVYYAKLTQIFWVSKNHIFHAYAWYKLYLLQKAYNKNLKEKDLQSMASCVVLSALAVPPFEKKRGQAQFEAEIEKERNLKMMSLLGFVIDNKADGYELPSRSALLSELVSKGVLSLVPQEIKTLYSLLETEFHPLDLALKAKPILTNLADFNESLSAASPIAEVKLEQYSDSLEKVATWKLLKQISTVYKTLKLKTLEKIVPFGGPVYLEKLILDAADFGYIHLKLNHQVGTLNFGTQTLETEGIRGQLVALAQRLSLAVSLIPKQLGESESTQVGDQETKGLQSVVEAEHLKYLARKVLIERRKEDTEREIIEKESKEKSEKLRLQRLTEEAEAKRLKQEQARRMEERIRREMEEKELNEAKALLEERRKKEGKKKGGKAAPVSADNKKLDKQSLLNLAMAEQLKAKAESERRVTKLMRQMDHLERAKREEEKPLILQKHEDRIKEDKEIHTKSIDLLLQQTKEQHEKDLAEKKRFARMLPLKAVFEAEVMSRRQGEFERRRREKEEKLAEIRAIKHAEAVKKRKMEFYRRSVEAEERRKLEEQLTKKRQEEERKRAEEREKQRKLDEIAEKQRKREAEAEEKARKEREQILKGGPEPAAPKPGKFVPPALRSRGANPDAPPGGSGSASRGADADKWERRRPVEDVSRDTPPQRPASSSSAGGGRFVPSRLRGAAGAAAKSSELPPSRQEVPPRQAAAAAAAPAGASRPAPSGSSGGGGKFVPHHLRNQQ